MKSTDTGDVNVAPEDKRPMAMVLLDRDGMGAARGLRRAAFIADSRHVAFFRVEVHHRLEEFHIES